MPVERTGAAGGEGGVEPDEGGTGPGDGAAEAGLEAVFDPFSGMSGDMTLGCWIDLGLDREWLREVADRLEVSVAIRVERVDRAGLSAVKVDVEPEGGEDPGDGHGVSFPRIRERIGTSSLGDRTRRLALGAFGRLAAAEGRVHGVPVEEVHFHEVGAADALVDICGAADGLVRLGIVRATTLPVGIGGGTVEIRHGRYPVPAPATGYLLEGTTVHPTGYGYECVTPTGAALLAEFTGGREPGGDLVVRRVGYGAGTHDPEDHPNCLRVWLTEPRDANRTVLVMQVDVDDMSPEYVPDLIEACLEAGALDATVQDVRMKKGRPGWRLEAQVEPGRREAVEEAIFRHSSTLGLRSWSVVRRALARRTERREWRGHAIRVKLRARPEGGPARGKPEYEDVAAAAAAEGLAPAEVLRRLRVEWPDLV